MSEPNEVNCQGEPVADCCDATTIGGYSVTINGADGAEAAGAWFDDNFILIIGSEARAALRGEPEESEPPTGDAVLAMVGRLKADNAALKAEVAELTRLFGDRVQDSEVAAHAVAGERKRLVAAVRAMARILRPLSTQSLEDGANLIADALENLP